MPRLTAFRGLLVAALVTLSLATPTTAADEALRGVAIVIGEGSYVRLPKLPNPVEDARSIDHMLDDLGFDVERILDARADRLKSELTAFAQKAANSDVAIIYYAGHGIEVAGENYLLGTDADISTPEDAAESLIGLRALVDELQATVPLSIVLLDACRTSPFQPGQSIQLPGMDAPAEIGPAGLAMIVRGPTPVTAPGNADTLGAVVGFSASPGQAALDGEPGANSPYAAALLKHLVAGGYSFGDVMTMVSQEVYVETRARQLPWTNSSLNRVLYFGRDAEGVEGDEAAILGDRRKLLLSIASAPLESKSFVEAVATEQDLSLAELYSMLDVIGGGDLSAADPQQLANVASRLREVLDNPLLPETPTDPELARLDALAVKALEAGAVGRAYDFRKQQAKRAAVLEKALDKKKKELDSERLELAGVYARIAETAMLNLDHKSEADQYKRAAKQVDAFDKTLSLKLRLRAAKAFAEQAFREGDDEAFETAIALFQDLLEEVDKAKQPDLWADITYRLGRLMLESGNRTGDITRMQAALVAGKTLTKYYKRENGPDRWLDAQFLLTGAQRSLNDYRGARLTLLAMLKELKPAKNPIAWARTQVELAGVLIEDGWWHPEFAPLNAMEDGIAAFRAAQQVFTRAKFPNEWAEQQAFVGENLVRLGARNRDDAMVHEGIEAFALALSASNPSEKRSWASLNRTQGTALSEAARYLNDVPLMQRSVESLDIAIAFYTRKRDARFWADTQRWRGDALLLVGRKTNDKDALRDAREAFAGALEVFEDFNELSGVGLLKGRIKAIDGLLK